MYQYNDTLVKISQQLKMYSHHLLAVVEKSKTSCYCIKITRLAKIVSKAKTKFNIICMYCNTRLLKNIENRC